MGWWFGRKSAPADARPFVPAWLNTAECDERGWPVGYLYSAGGQQARFDRVDALGRQQMAHIKALSPRDDHYGMGCLEAAIGGATVHNRAAKWNKALLDNGARPSGALSY